MLSALDWQAEKDRRARLRIAAEDTERKKEMERTAEQMNISARSPSVWRERLEERKRLGLRKGEWAAKKPCGTRAAYERHRLNGTPPCDKCITARREYEAERRLQAGMKPREPIKCGTNGGYRRHRRKGEQSCGPCREAHAEAARNRRQQKQSDNKP